MDLSNKKYVYIGSAVVLVLVAAVIFSVIMVTSLKKEVSQAQAENEQLQLTNEQLQLSNEYDAIDSEFRQYENQATALANDTILAKYTAAKDKVEQLMAELKNEKVKSAAQIKKLQDEIATLRSLLRHYVAQIDSLGKENAGLRAENAEIRTRNESLSSKVEEVSKQNETLTERITLAEKLNVSGVNLVGLKKNGKDEKKIKAAKQLMVSFTIPQNNSTPVGEKTIYLRIVSPEGVLLGDAGSFSFEGGSVPFTAKKTIEYTGEELTGIKIYWTVTTPLTQGEYTVELFCDNFRLVSRKFMMSK